MTGPFGVLFGLHLTSFGPILVTGQFRQVHTYAGCRAGSGEPLQMLSDASHPQHCPYTGADFSGSAPDFLPSQRLHPCCLLRLILSSWSSLFPVVPPRSILALTDLVLPGLFIYPRFNHLLI